MTNTSLKEALAAGLAAFERTESSQQEVRDVFVSLDDTIKEATSGKVSLAIQQAQELARPPTSGGLAGTVEYFSRPSRGESESAIWNVWMLQACGANGQVRFEELFRAQISQHGYPVSLKFLDERFVCHDRESLESTLKELLQRPEIGGKVRRLTDVVA